MKKNNKIKAIFFDVGGVLVKGKMDVVSPAVARIFGLPENKVVGVVKQNIDRLSKGEVNAAQFIALVGGEFRIPRKAGRGAAKILSETYAEFRKTNDAVVALAAQLKRSYRVGIISDTIARHSAVNLRREIYLNFRPVVLSYKVHCRKPFKDIFLLALKRAGVKPSEAVFIDDLARNTKGAKNVGMHAVQFKNVRHLRRELKKLGVL